MAYTFTGTIIGYSGSPEINLYFFESPGVFSSIDHNSHTTYSFGGGGGTVVPGVTTPTSKSIVVTALSSGDASQQWTATGFTRIAQDGNSGGSPGNVSWWDNTGGQVFNPQFTCTQSAVGVALVLGVDVTVGSDVQQGEFGGLNHAASNTLTTQPVSDPTVGHGGMIVMIGRGSTGFPTSQTLTDSWGNTWTRLFEVNDGSTVSISVWTTTISILPTVTTQAVTLILSSTATGNGTIVSLNSAASADHRGVVYDTASHSLPGNVAPGSSGYASSVDESGTFSTGAFTELMTGLSSTTTYYVRAYARDLSGGYSYGAEVSFSTLSPNFGSLFHYGGGQG